MAVNAPTPGGGFVANHPTVVVGAGVTIALLLGAYLLNKKNATPAATGTGSNLSGLATDANGNPIVYVPTSTSFSTDNSVNTVATSAPGAPATINTNTNTSAATTTSTSTVTTNPLLPVRPIIGGGTGTGGTHPVRVPPAPTPPTRGIHWTRGHHIGVGETLASIAAQDTGMVRAEGGPSGFRVTAQQIYSINQSTIDNVARSKHATPGINTIFPGTLIVLPEYR